MMHERNVQVAVEFPKVFHRSVQTTAADPELFVVVAFAKERAVDGEDAKPVAVDLKQFDGTAGGIGRGGADAVEITAVPVQKGGHFLCEVRLGAIGVEVGVGLLGRGEGAGEDLCPDRGRRRDCRG